MWYEIQETDIGKLRVGDLLMKYPLPVQPESIIRDINQFFIVSGLNDDRIVFKKADIVLSSINYSYTSFITDDLFKNDYWYCFNKRMVS